MFNEGIGLVKSSGKRDLLRNGSSSKIEGQLKVDDGDVHQSSLSKVSKTSVSKTISLSEAGQLSESGSD